MHEVNPPLFSYLPHIGALDSAIRTSLASKYHGLSTYDPGRPISLWMDDTAQPADDTTALSITAVHDPVFLSVDKINIAANNVDTATITVNAPKPGAAAVSLLVNGNVVPVTLTNGTGTILITSQDVQQITITVQNPSNRSTDQIIIQAV